MPFPALGTNYNSRHSALHNYTRPPLHVTTGLCSVTAKRSNALDHPCTSQHAYTKSRVQFKFNVTHTMTNTTSTSPVWASYLLPRLWLLAARDPLGRNPEPTSRSHPEPPWNLWGIRPANPQNIYLSSWAVSFSCDSGGGAPLRMLAQTSHS